MRPKFLTELPQSLRPRIEILEAIEENRNTGETLFETAHRCIVIEAMIRTLGCQVEAAKVIGTSPRVVCYHCHQLGIQDRQLRAEAKSNV